MVPKRAETGILLRFSCVRCGELVLFYLVQETAAKICLCRKGNRSEKGLESHVALARIMLFEITISEVWPNLTPHKSLNTRLEL